MKLCKRRGRLILHIIKKFIEKYPLSNYNLTEVIYPDSQIYLHKTNKPLFTLFIHMRRRDSTFVTFHIRLYITYYWIMLTFQFYFFMVYIHICIYKIKLVETEKNYQE